MKKLVFAMLFCVLGLGSLWAQKTFSGKVTENNGMGLPGVNVVLKSDPSVGASTDIDGNWTLVVPNENSILVFRSVGMKTLEMTAKSAKKIVMKADAEVLDNVVITAMGIKKTPDAVTSSQKIVSSEDIKKAGSSSAVEALTGRVSGLQINQTSSGVVGDNTITLRGSRSITGNNEALIIIDGAKSTASAFQQLPPEVIKSVNVIKGAQGAALYGSDGVNGVILVTTEGSKKRDSFEVILNTKVDFDQVAYLPERQKKYGQGWDGERILVENGGWGPAFDDPRYKDKEVYYGLPLYDYNKDGKIDIDTGSDSPTADTPAAIKKIYKPYGNNIKDFFKTGTRFTSDLTIKASGESKYSLLSLGYSKRDFIVDRDQSEKYSLLFKGGATINKWTLEGSINLTNRKVETTTEGIYRELLFSSSDAPITMYEDYPDLAYGWNVYNRNPYWYIKHNRYNNSRTLISTTGSLEYKMDEHISAKYIANLQNNVSDDLNYRDAYDNSVITYNLKDANRISSFLNKSNDSRKKYYGDLLINFDYDLNEDLNFKAMIGNNYQFQSYKVTSAGGTNLEIPGLYTIYNLKKPTQPYNLANGTYRKNSYAFFGNVDLAYKDYLFLNATARNEWSSVLPEDNNSYFYPSVGVSFIPTKAFEELANNGILNHAKIAANVTQVGNSSSIGWYDINNTTVLGDGFPFSPVGPTEGGLSFSPKKAPTSRDIKPEFVTSYELSTELGFFNNRITLASSYFHQRTKDLITYQSTSRASGIYRNKINIGKMKTTGVEVDLGLTPVKTEDWRWDVNFAYYTSNSEVLKVTDQTDEVSLLSGRQFNIVAKEGAPFPQLKASAYLRDDKGRIIIDPKTGNPQKTTEFKSFGRTTPKHTIGLNTTLRYKGFKFGMVMDYRTGHKFYANNASNLAFNGMLKESAEFDRTKGGFILPNSVYKDPQTGKYVENTTIKTGGTEYSDVTKYYGQVYNRIGENMVFDASAFKVRQISLSYTFAEEMISKWNIKGLTLGVYARNPITILASDNLGYNDPETSYQNSAPGFAGSSQYPPIRTYGFNVNIKF